MHNKLGFYTQVTIREGLGEAVEKIQPPVILNHAGDNTFWKCVRKKLSPNAFLIGRVFIEDQDTLFRREGVNPAAGARDFAKEVIKNEAFHLKTDDGRRVFDAWMSLNEAVGGPHTFETRDEEMEDVYSRYDTFQEIFAKILREEGVEAVGMNFGAGNFTDGEVWLKYFPKTLQTYTYLGFHEYGWPAMRPLPGYMTACLDYRRVMGPIREQYGDKHRVIITECGLTRAHARPKGPDEGWKSLPCDKPDCPSPLPARTPQEYWDCLKWYNDELNKDDYVIGACIYQVGHGDGRREWPTFEILGSPIIGWLAELTELLKTP